MRKEGKSKHLVEIRGSKNSKQAHGEVSKTYKHQEKWKCVEQEMYTE